VLVTGAPFWNDFERTSPEVAGCITGTSNALLYGLAQRWGDKPLQCLPHGTSACRDFKDLDATENCGGGCTQTYSAHAQLTADRLIYLAPLPPFDLDLLGYLLQTYGDFFIPPDMQTLEKSGAPHIPFPKFVPPDDGTVVVLVTIGKKPIVQTTAKVARGARANTGLWARSVWSIGRRRVSWSGRASPGSTGLRPLDADLSDAASSGVMTKRRRNPGPLRSGAATRPDHGQITTPRTRRNPVMWVLTETRFRDTRYLSCQVMGAP
jgi:hypothetical protein